MGFGHEGWGLRRERGEEVGGVRSCCEKRSFGGGVGEERCQMGIEISRMLVAVIIDDARRCLLVESTPFFYFSEFFFF